MIVESNRPTILLVCPATILRAVLKETLDKHQYNVMAVAGLGGAVDRLTKFTPDLLIVRPYLNNIDGHDAAIYLRSKAPGMRVLILDGMLDDDRLTIREALKSFAIFPKPFTVIEMLEKIDQVLSAPAPNSY